MKPTLSKNISNILICGNCGEKLHNEAAGIQCVNCKINYNYNLDGSLDLRLKKEKRVQLEFELGEPINTKNEPNIEELELNAMPEVDFSKTAVPYHLTKELLSYFPKAIKPDSLMLDLGCGGAIHKEVCEHAGFEWVGLDYDSPKAPILGDGHALPFQSNSFEFVLSIAVLEHIRYPFVMLKEVFRVLKENGVFIGTVAFLEPFHGDSYYHHTHLGAMNCLQYSGFKIKKLAPSVKWNVLSAQANMSLFPKMPQQMSKSIIYPIYLLHKLWWYIGGVASKNINENKRVKNTTGAFTFIARKD